MREGASWSKNILMMISLALLCGMGLLMVYSATHNETQSWQQSHWFKQFVFLLLGSGVLLFIRYLPLNFLYNLAYPLYALSLLFLLYFLHPHLSHFASHVILAWICLIMLITVLG